MSHYSEQREADAAKSRTRKKGPTSTQVGGSHYQSKIQPVDYVEANGLGFKEGNVVKYVTRWKSKGGVEDLRKARHYIDLLIEGGY